MRCLDQFREIIFQGVPKQTLHQVSEALVAVDIDNSIRWFFEKNTQEYWDYEDDFPCALSPWMAAWYEGGMPRFSNSEGQKIQLKSPFRKSGWLVHQMPLRDDLEIPAEPIPLTMLRLMGANVGSGYVYSPETLAIIQSRQPKFMQIAKLYGFTWDGRAHQLVAEYCYLDSNGQIIGKSRGVILLAPEQSKMPEDQKERIVNELTAPFLALYFSLSLIHSKNITLSDETTTQKKGKHNSNIAPKTRFKILDIRPLRETIKRASSQNSSTSEIQRALHLCRGHFRRYTDDSKLFGRHTGIFWIPEHKRGSEKSGKIEKDYRIS